VTEHVTAPPSAPTPNITGGWTRARLQRRVLTVVVISQLLGGAGLAAGVTVGALLARDMLGSTGLAGLPAALFTAGSAGAALLVGRSSDRYGRRPALAFGYAAGAVGGAGVVLAAVLDSVPLLLFALTIYGSGTATNLQARYAGADLAEPGARGRAISTVLVATTVGAVAGPNLVGVTGRMAESFGVPALAGPFALACLAYALAAVVLFVFLRPDPLLAARAYATLDTLAAAHEPGGTQQGMGREASQLRTAAGRTVLLAAIAMVLTQIVMVAIMTMTPLHLTAHHHGLQAVGFVIAVHIAAMFLPSPLTGWLADRYGRRVVLASAGIVLLVAGMVAALAPPTSVAALALALALLGLGWNLGLVGGTALLTDVTNIENRARTQGAVDVAIALAGATGGIASGAVVAAGSYTLLAIFGGILGLLILPITLRANRNR